MAGYSLIASESTVQVLSPTVVNDVVYCTILTSPSSVVASIPVQASVFDAGTMGPELTNFANAIEQIMALDAVIAAVGAQTIDPNGLIADQVAFTVQYVPAGNAATAITAEVLIPVAELNFSDGQIGSVLLQDVEAQINAAVTHLKNAAGG